MKSEKKFLRFTTWLFISLILLSGLPVQPQALNGKLHVNVSNLRNADGTARAALFNQADGFPGNGKPGGKAFRREVATIKNGTATLNFENLPAGTYAVVLFHDENKNEKLDTTMIGFPKEGVGFSNKAKIGSFGPPKFDAAKFTFNGAEQTIEVAVRY